MFQSPSFLLISLLVSMSTAFQFTFPSTSGTTLNFVELASITITWETNRTDPVIGRMLLVNTAVAPPSLTTITNRVEVAKKSHTVRREFGLGLVGGGTYHFTFMGLEDGDITVDSFEFTVEGGRDDGFGGVNATGISSAATSISTTAQTSVTTTSPTSAVATTTPSSTPNQSDGSSDRLLNIGLNTVLALVVMACIVT